MDHLASTVGVSLGDDAADLDRWSDDDLMPQPTHSLVAFGTQMHATTKSNAASLSNHHAALKETPFTSKSALALSMSSPVANVLTSPEAPSEVPPAPTNKIGPRPAPPLRRISIKRLRV